MKLFATCLLLVCLCGCAIHYFDSKTGKEHVWGIGHTVMKVTTNAETQAIIKRTDDIGFSVGKENGESHFAIGYNRRYRAYVGDNASVSLEWPHGDWFNLRIGTNFPYVVESSQSLRSRLFRCTLLPR